MIPRPTDAELDVPADIENFKVDEGFLATLFGSGSFDFDLNAIFGKKRPASQWRGRPMSDVPRAFHHFCDAHGIAIRGQMRFTERNLSPGDPAYVLGTAKEVPGVADEHERIVIGKGEHHPWYFIAESSEKEVLSKLSAHTTLFVFGGAAMSLAGLAWLLYRFGWLR